MFPRKSSRIGAVVILAVLALAAPAEAAGWGEIRDWAGGLRPRLLAWLGLAPEPPVLKDCSHVDPNGHCVKGGHRAQRPALSVREDGRTRH